MLLPDREIIIGAFVMDLAAYNLSEGLAQMDFPNRVIQAWRPLAFEIVGYPHRISHEGELWRFADVMHECRFERDFEELIGRLTPHEFLAFQAASEQCFAATQNLGQPILPRGALLRAIPLYRQLLGSLGPTAHVIEIGPGSGYLTFLLARAGMRVTALEASQAFYLWQDRFWLFRDPEDSGDQLKITHLAWWQFEQLAQIQDARAITANHCLNELHKGALAYIANLSASRNIPIIFEGYGSDMHRTTAQTNKILGDYGAHLIIIQGAGRNLAGPHTIADVKAWQIQFAGPEHMRTPDEKFLTQTLGLNGDTD